MSSIIMSSIEEKEKTQIKITEYMEKVLRDGLLGKGIDYVVNKKPRSIIFGGVTFPNSIFKNENELEVENEMDPDVRFSSISKNVSMGMEFLVNKKLPISFKISGEFSFFTRVKPTFEEQMESLNYLNLDKKDGQESDKQEVQKSKGLLLVEKYKKHKFTFNDVVVDYKNDGLILEQRSYEKVFEDFEMLIQTVKSDPELFKPKNGIVSKKGIIDIPKIFESEVEYNAFINEISDIDVSLPNYSFELKVDLLDYLHNLDNKKVIVTLINSSSDPSEYEFHPIELYDGKIEILISENLHESFIFDGVRNNYILDNKFDVKGLNCTAIAKKLVDSGDLKLVTEFMPRFFQQLYRTRDDIPVDFKDLIDPRGALSKLNEITFKMKEYASEWKVFIDNKGDGDILLKNQDEIDQCSNLLYQFEEEIKSFELGIYALTKDSNLMKGFNLTNQVFEEVSKNKYTGWRLFQIIFIVRMFPALYNREMLLNDPKAEEIVESSLYADVLWFPTGGGKTEAYLGTILTTLFFDRLRGKDRGVSAWLRFPLRMLSKDQLDRIAKILIVAEKFRLTDMSLNGKGMPFSIGFFAGGGNTDNFVSKKTKDEAFANEKAKINKMLIHKCPSCNGQVDFLFNESQWRYVHKCNNDSCFVKQNMNGNIPIFITDSEVYRFVPSVICGTVDKTAIAGRYREFSQLFGQAQGRCDKHGYFSDRCIVGRYDDYGSCDAKASKSNNEIMKTRNNFYDPVPTLFIQDELHLLKDELGSLSSHNEGYLMELAKTYGKSPNHIPKIIAATATIEAYEKHIKHLYMRMPRKYPSMGYKPGESFYATSIPKRDRRLYIGLLPHSKSQEEVIARAVYLYQKEIYQIYNNPGKYLNEFDIKDPTELIDLLGDYDLSTVYVNNKAMGYDIDRRLNEFEDLKLNTDFLTGENDMEKIVKVIDRIESEKTVSFDEKLNVLNATSLISHGVDLDRVNSFFMAGMPSKQSEYIQASSRSARSNVGLVFVSFKATNLKERSQYQYFIENHKFLDQLVDPVPINRMATKAVEKSFSSILCSLLLGIHSAYNKEVLDKCGTVDKYISNRNAAGNSAHIEILEQLYNIYGCNSEFFPLATREKLKVFIKNLYQEKMELIRISPTTANIKDKEILNPMNSFREIEEGIPIQVGRDTGIVLHYSKFSNARGGK